LSAQQAWQLAHNSFQASFIDGSRRQACMERLDAVFETFA
jgi:adenosine deaminase